MIRTSFSSLSLPLIYFPSCVSTVCDAADVAERRGAFLSLLSPAISLSLSLSLSVLLSAPNSAAFLMSYLSTRSAKYALLVFVRTARIPVIYDDPCLS